MLHNPPEMQEQEQPVQLSYNNFAWKEKIFYTSKMCRNSANGSRTIIDVLETSNRDMHSKFDFLTRKKDLVLHRNRQPND